MQASEKPVVYLSTPLLPSSQERESFDFFAYLLMMITTGLHRKGKDVVVKVATRSYSTSDQGQLLSEILKKRDNYTAILVAPFNTAEIVDAITPYIRTGGCQVPILTIDKALQDCTERNIDSTARELLPFAAVCDGEDGGRKAADVFHEHFEGSKVDRGHRRVLILEGLEGSLPRIRGFREQWERYGYSKRSLSNRKLDFTRRKARQCVENVFEPILAGREAHTKAARGIFACNDEMAIGAREAIEGMHRRCNQEGREAWNGGNGTARQRSHDILSAIEQVRIVGFDGIGEMKELLDRGDDWMLATIDVGLEDQSNALIGVLEDCMNNNYVNNEPIRSPVKVLKNRRSL